MKFWRVRGSLDSILRSSEEKYYWIEKTCYYFPQWKNEHNNKIEFTIVSILPQINIIKTSLKKEKSNKTVM